MNSGAKSRRESLFWLFDFLFFSRIADSFIPSTRIPVCRRQPTFQARRETSPGEVTMPDGFFSTPALEDSASKFKILTCMSTSCAKRRKDLGMDSFSTFAAFFTRSQGDGDGEELTIAVEEAPCLGACKMAPCVAVEHQDFVGTVSLEGMTDNEFVDRVFHNIVTEEDADRVWSSVIDAVKIMAEEEEAEI